MMKKLMCALFVFGFVCASMAVTFTVADYKAGFATVPVFYTGTLTLSNGFVDGECKALAFKNTYKMYASICQPCLDCYYDCAEVDGSDYDKKYNNPYDLDPKDVSGYVYYILDVDKKAKEVTYFVIPIEGNASFFNYDFQMQNKQTSLWQTNAVADEPFFYLVGVKDSKKWTFGKGAQKITLTASITKTFNGVASASNWGDLADIDGTRFFNGVVKLNRDDAITKKLMGEMVSGICGNIPCEDFIDSAFFEYVLGKSYKKYDYIDAYAFFDYDM